VSIGRANVFILILGGAISKSIHALGAILSLPLYAPHLLLLLQIFAVQRKDGS
jgi:hypothetical protein